jgi:hypothetical protein
MRFDKQKGEKPVAIEKHELGTTLEKKQNKKPTNMKTTNVLNLAKKDCVESFASQSVYLSRCWPLLWVQPKTV